MPSPGNMKYDKYVTTKGQLISKGHFGVFNSFEKQIKNKKNDLTVL